MSCTAHAVAGAFEFAVKKHSSKEFSPSRLALWYYARSKSDNKQDIYKNVGCHIRNAIKSLNVMPHGICSESEWRYVDDKYNGTTRFFVAGAKATKKPPERTTTNAQNHMTAKFVSFPSDNLVKLRYSLKHCLNEGFPFVFGMKQYKLLQNEYFNTNTYTISMPDALLTLYRF